ncbi:hypothetical protein [Zhihengliuella halotolerans]|uniref:hypothetical protein n=1 Tax=Zhihengliuella halotolerans TaxID=370736 RepID=UPI000C80C27D|nr:hypothetical protein [Zhihengliuella halotolerans]
MIGQEGVCRALVGRINARLAAECALVDAHTGGEAVPVPHPDNVFPYWVDLIESQDRLPAIMVMIEDTDTITSARQIDDGGEYDEYAHQYPVVVVIVNAGEHYGETELTRQRLMLATRNTILRHQSLIPGEGESARIDPDTLRESPSFGAQNQQTGQFLLESALRFTVRTQERLFVLDDLGRADITQDTGLIPRE